MSFFPLNSYRQPRQLCGPGVCPCLLALAYAAPLSGLPILLAQSPNSSSSCFNTQHHPFFSEVFSDLAFVSSHYPCRFLLAFVTPYYNYMLVFFCPPVSPPCTLSAQEAYLIPLCISSSGVVSGTSHAYDTHLWEPRDSRAHPRNRQGAGKASHSWWTLRSGRIGDGVRNSLLLLNKEQRITGRMAHSLPSPHPHPEVKAACVQAP